MQAPSFTYSLAKDLWSWLRPSKLQCSFNFSNSRCYVVNKATREIRYRVEVSVMRGREVKGCRALILKVVCPNKTEVLINHGLPFAPSQDNQLQAVDIVHGQLHYVDVLYILADNLET